jgi:hypothetical protein
MCAANRSSWAKTCAEIVQRCVFIELLIGVLRQKPDRLASRPMNRPGAGFFHAGQDVQQRGLAHAIRANQGRALTMRQRQRGIAEHIVRAVGFGNVMSG